MEINLQGSWWPCDELWSSAICYTTWEHEDGYIHERICLENLKPKESRWGHFYFWKSQMLSSLRADQLYAKSPVSHPQVVNFQRCEHVFLQHQTWVKLKLVLYLLLLTILQLYRLPAPVSNSSCLFTWCQSLYASCCTVLLYFSRYCKIKNVFFIFGVCFLCIICVKSIMNLLQYSIT